MVETVIAGLWAGYALAIPVGALAVLLVTLTAETSFRVGASGALGAATADALYATAALLGGAALAQSIRPVEGPLRGVAAAILIGMALYIGASAVRRHRTPDKPMARPLGRPARAYFGFLGLTLLSPWVIVYFTALILGGHIGADAAWTTRATFVGAVFTASATWQLFLATGGAVLGRRLTGPKARLTTALASSLIIASLALTLLSP